MEIRKSCSFLFLLFLLLAHESLAREPTFEERLTSNKLFDANKDDPSFVHSSMVPAYIRELIGKYDSVAELALGLFAEVENKECAGHLSALLERFENLTVAELWALKMFDSYAKPPEGILSGHINPMGDFKECVSTAASNVSIIDPVLAATYPDLSSEFTGRYCTVYVTPKPTPPKEAMLRESVSPEELLDLMSITEGILVIPSIGTCFPSTCTQFDVQRILNNTFDLHLGTLRPTVSYCATDKKADLDAADISVIALLSAITGICLFAAIIDYWTTRGLDKPPRRGLGMQYLMAFSLYTNVRKWLNTRSSGDDLGCVHGIRFLSTAWVILAHTWYTVTFIPVWNMVDLKNVYQDWTILTVLNSTVSVDTFFVLSGMLVAYNLLKMLDKTKGKINIPMFYIHRYLRLTPTYAILVGIMATVFPYFGSGPFWMIMERWSAICEDNWWTNLLYVNNFVNTSMLCQGEAWYLANDMQFYIISPLYLYPLWRWETFGLVLLGISTLLSILCPGLMVYFMKVPPTTIGTRDLTDGLLNGYNWFTDIYIKPWSRIQTYFVGIFLGYLLFKTRGKKVKISALVQMVGWLISTGTALSVLYGIYPYFDPAEPIPRIEGLLYGGLNRFGWGVSIAWIIFACVKGYGGLINSFLSWKVFIPLGRLCFCVYLVSLHLQMVLQLSAKVAVDFTPYYMTNYFFSHMVMAFMVGFALTMTLESPFIVIEKLIFEGPAGGRQGATKDPSTDGLKRPAERYGIYYNNQDVVINAEPQKTVL